MFRTNWELFAMLRADVPSPNAEAEDRFGWHFWNATFHLQSCTDESFCFARTPGPTELEQSGVSPSILDEVSDPMGLSLRAFWTLQGVDFMVDMVMAVLARGNCCPP